MAWATGDIAMLVILFYGLVFGGLAVLALLFYLRAANSRRTYTCPQCGERVRVELMDASSCNMCGAPLNRGERD